MFCGENRSHTISEKSLLGLGAPDHGRVVNDGTGLSGRAHAGTKGISVHFRYRYCFEGASREVPLGGGRAGWSRSGRPGRLVAEKLKTEQAQLTAQQQELTERGRQDMESQLTLRAMFEAWLPEPMVDNLPSVAQKVSRRFELHLLPHVGTLRVSEVTPAHIRQPVRALIDAGKISTDTAFACLRARCLVERLNARPWKVLSDREGFSGGNTARTSPILNARNGLASDIP